LKEKLDLLAERVRDSDKSQRDHALQQIKQEVANATSSMTSVPKPLKFLQAHYDSLKEFYAT